MRTKYGCNTELAEPEKLADNVWEWDPPPPVEPVFILIETDEFPQALTEVLPPAPELCKWDGIWQVVKVVLPVEPEMFPVTSFVNYLFKRNPRSNNIFFST